MHSSRHYDDLSGLIAYSRVSRDVRYTRDGPTEDVFPTASSSFSSKIAMRKDAKTAARSGARIPRACVLISEARLSSARDRRRRSNDDAPPDKRCCRCRQATSAAVRAFGFRLLFNFPPSFSSLFSDRPQGAYNDDDGSVDNLYQPGLSSALNISRSRKACSGTRSRPLVVKRRGARRNPCGTPEVSVAFVARAVPCPQGTVARPPL